MSKKSLVKGTLILAIAGITSKLLGFFFRIPLINMIGEEGIGLYQLTYPLYTFLLGIAAGIPVAISKMVSEQIALYKRKEALKVFKTAIFVMAVFGALSSGLLILLSRNIISAFKWSSDSYYSIIGISLAPLFTCLLSAYRGYFQGVQQMSPPAVSQILEQLVRIIAGVGLAYILLPFGIDKAAGGAAFGATAGALAALIMMIIVYMRNNEPFESSQPTSPVRVILKRMIYLAIPISIAQAIGSVMALIDSIQVPGLLMSSGYSYQLATKLYGQLTGKAHVLINVPLTLSMALSISAVPAISESNAVHNIKAVHRRIVASYKLGLILALPCCCGLYALAKPILSLVFQGMSDGWRLLQILSVATIFIVIAQISTSILNALGRTVLPVITMAIGCIIKIVISAVFIPVPALNISAAAYSTVISYIVVALLDFIFVLKYTKVKIPIYKILVGPMIASTLMTFGVMGVYLGIYQRGGSNGISCILSVFAGMVVYMVMLIVTGTIGINEIKDAIKNKI